MVVKKYKHIVPLYDHDDEPSLFIVFCDEEGYNKTIKELDKKNENKEERPSYKEFSGYTFCRTIKGIDTIYSMYSIDNFFDSDLEINCNTVTHEATHIRSHIYLSLGIEVDLEKDEPEAYLNGWIAGVIQKDSKKYLKEKIKINE